MFTKLFQKNAAQPPPTAEELPPAPAPALAASSQEEDDSVGRRILTPRDVNPRVTVHYGIPSTASLLAYDAVLSLLAVATLDGRIKVIGGDNIEGLLVSPKQFPFKHLEFLQNQGFLVSVSSENEIQVWDLDQRRISSNLQWESSITAFSVIDGSSFMYVGDEYGMVSVIKYDAEEGKILQLPYYVSTNTIAEASGVSSPINCSVVGVLSQPSSQGNRLLIAYEDGLIVLWDASEDKVILVRGNKDLQLQSKIATKSHEDVGNELVDDSSEYEEAEKEISSLCWASTDGSFLAVGYVDGDIMLWNLSVTASAKDHQAKKSTNDVVKLQLSSAARRLPVIVLRWSANRSHNGCSGQLFVYGGDAIGSEEVLTILNLDWSSGIKHLKCLGRVDLTLIGSFADMVLVPSDMMERSGTLVLTNPGQLHFYDDAYSSSIKSQQEGKNSVSSIPYPMAIPTTEPRLTVGKLYLAYKHGKLSKAFSETISVAKLQTAHTPGSTDWPLSGGVPSELFLSENYQVERLYIAGYQDGSARIWDATYPTFSLLYVLGSEVKGINIAGANALVSALDFCPINLSLAFGNELGMVFIYKLIGNTNETSLNFVTTTRTEVHTLHQGDGPQCSAMFSIISSPICILQFANTATRLAVGFLCGRVAMLDISTLSVLFLLDGVCESSSPVNSVAMKLFSDAAFSIDYSGNSESKSVENNVKSEVLLMTKDANFVVIDGNTGSIIHSQSMQPEKESTLISMYIIEESNFITEGSSKKNSFNSFQQSEAKGELAQSDTESGKISLEVELETSAKNSYSGQSVEKSMLLLCFEDALCLYSLTSLNEVDNIPTWKVKLLKPCCWTATFKKNDKVCGLIVVYQTGAFEIRSFPNLELVEESSLMSILRWNFKSNMEKTICSSDRGQIMLVNGCEFASISLLSWENDFRIPESLPRFHSKFLAAAADATFSSSPSQNKMQGATSGILGGIIKGFQVDKAEHIVNPPEVCKTNTTHLESLFLSPPFLKHPMALSDDQKVVQLSIDDIDIDEPLYVSSSSGKNKNDATRGKGTERERLFEDETADSKPQLRTAEEIKAKYRREDPSSAATLARDKLMQRKEKLERLSQRTEELRSGAENFQSMANDLVKQMEKRKWWNI